MRLSEYRPGPFTVVLVSVSALAAGTFAISAPGVLAPKLAAAFHLSRAEIGVVTSLFSGRTPLYSAVRQVLIGAAAAAITYGSGALIGVSLG